MWEINSKSACLYAPWHAGNNIKNCKNSQKLKFAVISLKKIKFLIFDKLSVRAFNLFLWKKIT